MLGTCHKLEVFNSIISPDPVNVVNNLVVTKWPTYNALHNNIMNNPSLIISTSVFVVSVRCFSITRSVLIALKTNRFQ